MAPNRAVQFCVTMVGLLFGLAACGGNYTVQPQTGEPLAATPDPLLATPQPVLAEGPLQGQIPEIPNVFIVPSRQPKASLAAFLKTTPEQLEWVNPGLPDPITPGTLVVIPPIYRTSDENLSGVSQKTGLTEEQLLAANPQLKEGEILAPGTVLAVPSLYIVPAETSLSSVAQTLDTDREALLSANPELAQQEDMAAGTVLVVPLESKD